MLNQHVARYVALHRQLGLRYNQQERILGLFAAYAEGCGDRYITTDRIRSWCATASTREPRKNLVRYRSPVFSLSKRGGFGA